MPPAAPEPGSTDPRSGPPAPAPATRPPRGGPPPVAPAELRRRFAAARAESDEVVLEGFHALKHALRFGADVRAVVAADVAALERLAAALAPDLAGELRSRATAVAPADLAALAPRAPATGVLAIAARPPVDAAAVLRSASGPVVLLEDPRHLGNVGAVVRVAAAAGAAAVLATGTADPWGPAALRGSAGLHFALPVARLDPAARSAPREVAGPPAPHEPEGGMGAWGGRPLIALDPHGDPLEAGALPPDAVLAFGSERHGLSEALLNRATARVAIPMRPGVSSLNLATAVAVVLYAGGSQPIRTNLASDGTPSAFRRKSM